MKCVCGCQRRVSQTSRNVSFTVPSGARLGILGRTGAGKTSLMSAIYSYFAEYDGDILYDGKKIRSIDLQQLRSSITIIPQEPVLFPGSLRKNLDPFSRFENDEILKALDEVQLSSKFSKEGLDFHVDGGGANISQGERQLICFARALLTETPLVLMDEATASVDPNTEATIRKLLEQRFKNRTVLMIAHKLQTVLSCELILVLEQGKVVEFGRLDELRHKEGGLLWSLLKEQDKIREYC